MCVVSLEKQPTAPTRAQMLTALFLDVDKYNFQTRTSPHFIIFKQSDVLKT